jgi:hypothetical protein
MRKRELLQRLLDDESRKYEGKDTDKANLLLDLVAQFVLVEPKVESVRPPFHTPLCLEQLK